MSKRSSPLLLVTVSLLGAVACKPTLPPDGPNDDAVAAVDEIEDDGTQDVTTAADSTATPPDADAQTDTMALDTMALDGGATDAAQDTAPPPGPACEVSATKAPVPGTPCTSKGEVRCSDVGRYTSPKNMLLHESPDPFCLRPNIVRCELVGGSLRWVLNTCPKPKGPKGCATASLPLSCSEAGGAAHCCPAACFQDPSPRPGATGSPPLGFALRCAPGLQGTSVCPGGAGRRFTCTTPGGTESVKRLNDKYFHECASLCAGCTYWFTSEVCGYLRCKKSKDQKPPCTPDTWEKMCSEHGGLPPSWDWPPYPAACIAQPDNNGPCQKTCEELGLFTP